MSVGDVTTYSRTRDLGEGGVFSGVNPRSGRNRRISSTAPCGLAFRRRVKITTMEVRSLYRPGVQDSEVGNIQISARVCVEREATVPQGASCVCESVRVGGDT